MTQTILDAFLGAAGAGVLTLLVMAIKFFYKKIVSDDKTLKALAHDAFWRSCYELYPETELTKAQIENFEYLYAGYKAQELNHTGDKWYKEIMEKPIRAEGLSDG